MVMPAPGSGPISAPDDFPVSWGEPEEAQHFWFWDQMHHPRPVTPMTGSIDALALSSGFTKAGKALSLPLESFKSAIVNHYWYMSAVPLGSPQETAARLVQLQATMMEESARALELWEQVYLPEVLKLNDCIRHYPYQEAGLRELAAFLEEARAIRERQFEIHSMVVFPVMLAATTFGQFYEGMFGRPENNEHYQMLGGFPNKTVEAGRALFELSREMPPMVAETVRQSPVERLLAQMEESSAGRKFRRRLDRYLEEYGWRSDAFEFMDPSWQEDPRPVLHNLKGYLPEGATDPAEEQRKAAAERERLVAGARQRLAGNGTQLAGFEAMLRAAQTYLPVQENHNFYIDQMNTVLMRWPILELGRRLQRAGALDEVNDIFFLTAEEVCDIAVAPESNQVRGVIAERRTEWERWAGVVPPLFLGTAPPAGAPTEVITRFFGGGLVEGSRDPRVIAGHGASKGVARGPAKVVRTLSESDKLEPGDVLVCEMTMPAWTPLFSIVSAVVADSGGVLSHCAIVAREYGIPCVVGTQQGTRRIKDGQTLTVDGAKGIVRIEG